MAGTAMTCLDSTSSLGERLNPGGVGTGGFRHTVLNQNISELNSRRRRVRIYEGWYREPEDASVIQGGPYHGELADFKNQGHMRSVDQGFAVVEQRPIMRMKLAYFIEKCVLSTHDSPFKHNDFPFTPIYAFRRGRDGLPYGFVRNQRDAQEDLNKRMSKALFILSVTQLITEKGAFSDREGEYTIQDAIDNVSNPQGVFILQDGEKRFEFRRDYAESAKQIEHVMLDRQFMQATSGVTDELLGRRTNAVSGEAIRARQDQGSATTADLFDNYRLAIQVSGAKQLSNAEQFTPKDITGSFASQNKVYDGNTAAVVLTRTLSGVVAGDQGSVTLSGVTASFGDAQVGNGKTVTLTGASLSGCAAGNYNLAGVGPALADITAKTLSVTGAAVVSKVYDGTTDATITGAVLDGVITGDEVTLVNGTTGTFADKNVGSGKSVATEMSLGGGAAGNYTLVQPTLTGNITARGLVYDL